MRTILYTTLLVTCCALSSCLTPIKPKATDSATAQELKAVGNSILETTEIAAAQTSLDAAKAKLAELRATPATDASFTATLTRGLALATAQSLVDMAQTRLDKLKAQQRASVSDSGK